MKGLAEFNLTIDPALWQPCGPEEDERAVLQCALIISGAKLYLLAYAVHHGLDCDEQEHADSALFKTDDEEQFRYVPQMHGVLGDLTAYDRLADAHCIAPDVQTVDIDGREYALFAEPAEA